MAATEGVLLDTPGPLTTPLDLTAMPADEGSVIIRFSATTDSPLLLITGTNGHLSLTIDHGRINGEQRIGNQIRRLDAQDVSSLVDGAPHTIAVVYNSSGIHLFLDGYQGFCCTPIGWLKAMNAHTITVDPEHVLTVHQTRILTQALTAKAVIALSPPPTPFLEFATDELSTRDAARCSTLTSGSLYTRFRCRGLGQSGTILAARGSAGELTLTIQDGSVHFTVTANGEAIAQSTAPGHWDDGVWHEAVVTAGHGAVIIYIDGYQVGLTPGAAFFGDLGATDRVTVGKNLANNRLFGEVHEAAIFDTPLTDYQVKRLCNAAPLDTVALFDSGMMGSESFRIPSLITLDSGVVLAGADERVSIANDSPNDINFVIRRSCDDGRTWEEPRRILSYPGSGRQGSSVTDAVLVQDRGSGRVIALFDHFPGGIGQLNSAVGTGFDSAGNQILHDRSGKTYTWQPDGSVVDEHGEPTAFRVAENGDVTSGGQPAGNVYLAHGADPQESLFTFRSGYIQMITSNDDGLTWSEPEDITASVKQPWMRFLGMSPGNGIQLRHGDHKGRILAPVYFSPEHGHCFSAAAIFSDDGGLHWELGGSPNDGREVGGATVHSRDLADDRASLYESVLVEDADGTVHVYARNQHPSGRVAHATSEDGGLTWSDVDYPKELLEIFSQPNAIALPKTHEDTIVFANASRMLPFRGCGVIRMSCDGGATWGHNRVFNPRHYVYQCMTELANGDIGLLWEREQQGLYFSRLPVNWLTESQQTMS